MDILGIGPLELVAILVIALIVLGPKDMVKAGKTIGRTMRTIVSSETWHVVQQASREIRNLPNRMMREAGIEELQKQLPDQSTINKQLGLDELTKDLKKDINQDLSPWTTPPATIAPPNLSNAEGQSETRSAEDATAWTTPPAEDIPDGPEANPGDEARPAAPGLIGDAATGEQDIGRDSETHSEEKQRSESN